MGQALILLWVCLRARRLPTRREGVALVLALLGAFLLATHGSLTALALSPQALFWGLCAAVGLNWKYSTQEALQQAEETGTKILGEATLVSGQEGTELAEDTVYEGDDYFASARLTRQQARDSAISLLEDAAKQEDADKEVANQASESIQVLASYTLKEAQIENLVTAKGYTDCVAFMGDDSLSIVVSTADGTLNSTDVAKITDIAMTETGYAASAIRIMASN